MKVGEIGSGPVWSVDLGVGTVEGVGLGPESGVGVWVRRLVLVYTSALFWISCWCSNSHPCGVSCHPSLFWTVVFQC